MKRESSYGQAALASSFRRMGKTIAKSSSPSVKRIGAIGLERPIVMLCAFFALNCFKLSSIPRMYLEKQELNAPHRQYVRNVLLWYSYGREDCLRIENRAICFLPVKAITSKVRAGPLAVDTRGKART